MVKALVDPDKQTGQADVATSKTAREDQGLNNRLAEIPEKELSRVFNANKAESTLFGPFGGDRPIAHHEKDAHGKIIDHPVTIPKTDEVTIGYTPGRDPLGAFDSITVDHEGLSKLLKNLGSKLTITYDYIGDPDNNHFRFIITHDDLAAPIVKKANQQDGQDWQDTLFDALRIDVTQALIDATSEPSSGRTAPAASTQTFAFTEAGAISADTPLEVTDTKLSRLLRDQLKTGSNTSGKLTINYSQIGQSHSRQHLFKINHEKLSTPIELRVNVSEGSRWQQSLYNTISSRVNDAVAIAEGRRAGPATLPTSPTALADRFIELRQEVDMLRPKAAFLRAYKRARTASARETLVDSIEDRTDATLEVRNRILTQLEGTVSAQDVRLFGTATRPDRGIVHDLLEDQSALREDLEKTNPIIDLRPAVRGVFGILRETVGKVTEQVGIEINVPVDKRQVAERFAARDIRAEVTAALNAPVTVGHPSAAMKIRDLRRLAQRSQADTERLSNQIAGDFRDIEASSVTTDEKEALYEALRQFETLPEELRQQDLEIIERHVQIAQHQNAIAGAEIIDRSYNAARTCYRDYKRALDRSRSRARRNRSRSSSRGRTFRFRIGN